MPAAKQKKKPRTVRKPPDEEARLIGYARVSTQEQNLEMQRAALRKAGVRNEDIYGEKLSGTAKKRPRYDAALRNARPGDTLVVWKLDRLARSVVDLLNRLEHLETTGIKFRSLTEGIETVTPGGRLMLHVLAALAQFERDLVSQRSKAGVQAARERGSQIGAKPKLDPADVPKAVAMRAEGTPMKEIAEHFGVSTQTIRVRCNAYEAETAKPRRKRK